MTNSTESDNDRTLFCGNLSDKITEELLYELFVQAGPLFNVKVPSDKDGRRRNFGFILFKHACSVPYALKLLNGIRLHGRCLNLQFRSGSVHSTPPRVSQQNSHEGVFPPSPMMDERGLPLLNGVPNMMGSRMGPPLPMQSLISPGSDRPHRSFSAPTMPPPQFDSDPHGHRDRGRDGSRDGRDRSRDRGGGSRDRQRDGGRQDGRQHRDREGNRDRDFRTRDREYRNQSQDRGRNSSQERSNDSSDVSMSRLRKGETYHGFTNPPSLMGSSPQQPGPPGLMGPGPPGDMDLRRSQQSGPRPQSQRSLPPWQRPY